MPDGKRKRRHRVAGENDSRCPDCSGRIEDHNAVNRVPGGILAHNAQLGACWKSFNTEFVRQVRAYLLAIHSIAE